MQRIMILGAGTMGAGIAQVVATAGYSVVLKDISDGLVRRGFEIIEKNLGRAVEKGKMTADRKGDVLGAIVGVSDPVGAAREASDCDLVIEAILEDIEAKKAAYRELDAVCPSETVFATNTSALSVSGLAASTGRPDRFLGLHFFNPVPVMQIVEVVPGLLTSERTLARGTDFVKTLGKTPLPAADSPGFIVNRILLPMINEAAYALMEGVANSEDIDTAMKLGTNHPMGPLALADLIGLDICLSILETLQAEFGDPKYRPCPLIRRMVRAGWLGRKSGRGFYTY
jgi:3-hydroxybutyryl-CoA dehydrogenase